MHSDREDRGHDRPRWRSHWPSAPGLRDPAPGPMSRTAGTSPRPFRPFEYLVGRWKGQAMPKDIRPELPRLVRDAYLGLDLHQGEADRPLGRDRGREGPGRREADFRPGPEALSPRGTEPKPGGGPIAFEGALDASRQDPGPRPGRVRRAARADAARCGCRSGPTPTSSATRWRSTARNPATSQFSLCDRGRADQGGRIAGRGDVPASERPKCIVTGGAATMTLTYKGRTFPICCTGCRDEFNENPEKYIKKASLMAESRGSKARPASRRLRASGGSRTPSPATSPIRRRCRPATAHRRPPPRPTAKAEPAAKADDDTDAAPAAGKSKSATKKGEPKTAASPPAARAARPAAGRRRTSRNPGKADAALGLLQADRQGLRRYPRRQDRQAADQGAREALREAPPAARPLITTWPAGIRPSVRWPTCSPSRNRSSDSSRSRQTGAG